MASTRAVYLDWNVLPHWPAGQRNLWVRHIRVCAGPFHVASFVGAFSAVFGINLSGEMEFIYSVGNAKCSWGDRGHSLNTTFSTQKSKIPGSESQDSQIHLQLTCHFTILFEWVLCLSVDSENQT